MQTRPSHTSALAFSALAVALLAGIFSFPATAVAEREAPFNGAEAVTRSKVWVRKKVSYSQTSKRLGYRRDCSGLVSMAWDLPENLVTWRIPLVARPIPKKDLRPGDVLLDHTSQSKHVIIFERWADRKRTSYVGIEQTGQTGVDKAVRRVLPYPYRVNKGHYRPWRYVGMDRYWKAVPRRQRQRVWGYSGPEITPELRRARELAAQQREDELKLARDRKEAENAAYEARVRVLKAIERRRPEKRPKAGMAKIASTADGASEALGRIVVSLAETVFRPAVSAVGGEGASGRPRREDRGDRKSHQRSEQTTTSQ